jgi:hypothetical protein
MVTGTLERELIGLEKRYWESIKAKDFEGALRLSDDPCIVAGAQGVSSLDHETFRAMMKGAEWELHDFRIDEEDAEVRVLNDDLAIVAYKVHEKLTVDGKKVDLEASDASTWVRRDGRWLCALHTESLTGDPFGRDRR